MVRQLSERLVKMGHRVTVVTSAHPDRGSDAINGVQVVSFAISGNAVHGYTGDTGAYQAFLRESRFDIVTFFAAQQWATDLALPMLGAIQGKKVSVPTGYSGFYQKEYEAYYEQMRSWIKGYDMNVYLSYNYRDINFARHNGVTQVCIIPNGASGEEFLPEPGIDVRRELGIAPGDFLLLHVGSYTGLKGHKETLEIFFRSKLKHATLLMIGDHAEKFAIGRRSDTWLYLRYRFRRLFNDKRVVFKAFPRAFTVAAYKQADLFIFPSNIECSPVVLFECAAARLPFMATDVGNTVEIAEWTGGGKIMPTYKSPTEYSYADIAGSVTLLNSMSSDRPALKRMGDEAFARWKEQFSWEKIAKAYEQLYQLLAQRS